MLIFGTWAIISPFFINSSFFCIDSKVTHLKNALNWMKNKKVQILEFGFCWSLSMEFISKTARHAGN